MRAWRLPMGFTAWPPWRPGVLFTGDSLGAGKPASGAGISKALESGLAAGECAIAALTNGGPDDFTNYAQRMEAAWGKEYRRGRYFHKLAGMPSRRQRRHQVDRQLVLPRPHAQGAVQEGTGPAAQGEVGRCSPLSRRPPPGAPAAALPAERAVSSATRRGDRMRSHSRGACLPKVAKCRIRLIETTVRKRRHHEP